MKLYKRIIITAIVGTLLSMLAFYIMIPPLNGNSEYFWFFLTLVIGFYSVTFLLTKGKSDRTIKQDDIFNENGATKVKYSNKIKAARRRKAAKYAAMAALNKKFKLDPREVKICIAVTLIPFVIMLIGSISSSKIFNARAYASIIQVEEAVFEEDMKETDEVTNIALMDSESAKIIGNRTLGSLSDVVSQFEMSDKYTQINYKNTPRKVANLEYAGLFKWMINRKDGVPGYVMVDPVNNTAEYVKLDTPLKYVQSAFFSQDLMRKLRFSYPTKIFGQISYEIDEQGKPYYIVSCSSPNVSLFGGKDINEVIIFDPCTGDSQLYNVKDVPAWVDIVYSGYLAMEKYNWKGMLSGGYINSIIGQKGCQITTDDYGFIVIGDDVWYFTGVTSITSDESNIGFIITNARTGEYKYYPVVGAEEYSAMKSAEGEVQEKGYKASFPSLINVRGEATYIMVLKDDGGLVRLYALVNVENYGIVATAPTQAEAMAEYKRLLAANGIIEEEPEPEPEYNEAEINVISVRDIVINGNSYIYIEGDDGIVYKGSVAEHEELVLVKPTDRLKVRYDKTQTGKIRAIQSFSVIE